MYGTQNKWCFVPECRSTSASTPNKIFISVPRTDERRRKWFQAIRRDYPKTKSSFFCCEDHFNLEEDMENYVRYKLMGGSIFLKKDVVPHIFANRTDQTRASSASEPLLPIKRKKKQLIEDALLSYFVTTMDDQCADDPMEIDDPVPVTPIIERRSEEFSIGSSPALATLNEPKSKVEVQLLTTYSTYASDINGSTPNKPSEAKNVIILDDDEDQVINLISSSPTNSISQESRETQIKEVIDLIEKPISNKCINASCDGKSLEYIFAPDFCLSYFRVKKSSNNKEEICMNCYYKSVEDNDHLATSLKEGKLLFSLDFPIKNETLQIDDSDEEENDENSEEYISDENFQFLANNFESILMDTLNKYDVKNHLEKERQYLNEQCTKVDLSFTKLEDETKQMRNILDKMQIELYNEFRPPFNEHPGISILDDYSISPTLQVRSESIVSSNSGHSNSSRKSDRITQKNLAPPVDKPSSTPATQVKLASAQSVVDVPKDLPITTVLDKPEPKPEDLFYIEKENNTRGCWIKARLQEIIPSNTTYKDQYYSTTHYRFIELKQQKERIVPGRLMAYLNFCNSRLVVGSRVLSQFKETILSVNVASKRPRAIPYYPGVVGEHPVVTNKYRYLIFFDIGYAQYVKHSGVNLILDANINVWEDMPADTRPFIRKYLESQDRPMVKLRTSQTVKVEYNGKWWLCTVKDVDCSLVQVFFIELNRWEWIYRGSTRLSPMFREEMAATTRQTGLRTPRKLGVSESATVIQYTRNDDFVQPAAKENTPPTVTRAVARKSTTKLNATNQPAPKCVPFLPPVSNTEQTIMGPTSKIMYFTPRDQKVTQRQYRPHECGPACKVYITHNFTKLRGHNPLSKPLLCGWARMTLKDRGRKEIIYNAPCGRMIRNISEIHYYLRVTESEMTVDLFDFNHMVRCLAEFSVECPPDPADLSKGLEQVPIPVINGFNNDMLDFCNYSTRRVPMEGVYMNLDEEFLCGCDCEDDCADKLKCSCWKLTLDGIKYLGKDVDPTSVGYIYRRLQEQVITGIYECNSRCKCSSTCLNRVAQNPLSLKLQVFKTNNRGWGIRCLNDVPQGTFICIYAGTLHTEQTANEDGMQYGDEYFAELDYIETVEKYKEDYEEEAMEDDDIEREKSPPPLEEPKSQKWSSGKKRYGYSEDNDFTPSVSTAVRINNSSAEGDQGIRSRLRRRKDDDEKKDKKNKDEKDNLEDKDNSTVKVKQEPNQEKSAIDLKILLNEITELDTVTISDDDDDGREVLSFNPMAKDVEEKSSRHTSVRELFGPDERDNIYIMDAKNAGNIGRFLNHSCSPNVFVQNVFVDTHDVRFPWVAFFSSQFIRAGTELTWNYNYDIGSVPGRVLYCHCASLECKGRLL